MSTGLRILLVDEDRDDRTLAALVLRHALTDTDILEAGDPLEFADRFAEGGFSVAIAEARLGWADGIEVLQSIKRRYPECATLLFTDALPTRMLPSGVDARLPKSSHGFLELPVAVRRARDEASLAASDPRGRLLEQLPVGIFALDADGRIIEANRALAELLGFTDAAALHGLELAALCAETSLRGRLEAALSKEHAESGLEVGLKRAGGEPVRVSMSLWPLGEPGDAAAFEGVAWRLPPAAGEGAPERGELEGVAYAVSHDLQDPLQLITQYARLLRERHGDALDSDAARLINRLVESAGRMQSMIDSMLNYSSVALGSRTFAAVDLNEVLAEALDNLRASVDESGARIEHPTLPAVTGDRRQLVQLLQNLVGNAIKFRGQEPPQVRLTAEDRGREWLISVADNGIGIDPRFAERIFDIFKRLHTADEYPGTGIGLALCKRIAERHGGRIWVDSRPGQGSTFHVTLAKNPQGGLGLHREDHEGSG